MESEPGRPTDAPRALGWVGPLVLGAAALVSARFLGREFAVGTAAGALLGMANFKAIGLVVRRVLGPSAAHRGLYALLGVGKFLLLAGIVYVLVYHRLVDPYGLVAGFTAVLALVLVEAAMRAGATGPSKENGDAS